MPARNFRTTFSHVGVGGDGHEILRFERKVSGAFEIVMAVETILRNDGPVVRGKLLGRRRAARQHERGAEASARYDRECSRQTAPRIATPHDLANVATQRAAVDCLSVVAHIPTTGEGPFAVRQRYGNDLERIRTSERSLEVEWAQCCCRCYPPARRSCAASRAAGSTVARVCGGEAGSYPLVAGSSPARPTNLNKNLRLMPLVLSAHSSRFCYQKFASRSVRAAGAIG